MSVLKMSNVAVGSLRNVFFIFCLIFIMSCSDDSQFEFQEGDRIAIIGNSLAERMQHDGWLETYLQSSYPENNLVIRNLGYSGDQVHYRPRAHEGFGDSDSHLTAIKANVIFSFFGYNESFEDKPEEFKEQLNAWVDHVRLQKYDSLNTPRIVIFSPIAHENLGTPNLPDGSENNTRLARYTEAMSAVAQEKQVLFVNLFDASQEMYEASQRQLTINGVHLNEEVNRQIALYIVKFLSGNNVDEDKGGIDSLRSAVVDKNLHWFHRYRTISGNDVWGTRSSQDGNLATLQQELKML